MFLFCWFYILLVGLFTLVVLVLAKFYFQFTKGVFHSDADLTGKVILITGGNTGIGKEYVRDVARRNGKVIMACRNVDRGIECAKEVSNETQNPKILIEKCDLSSLQSVQSFCELIKKREQKIDVLVCFAAAVGENPDCVQTFTEDGLQMQFQCNYLSHFLMIHLLIGVLTQNARIILTGSSAHLVGKIDLANISRFELYGKHLFFAYADSKLALVMLAKELSDRLENKTSINANSFHPGTVYTNGIKHNHFWYIKYFLTFLAFIYGKSAKDGAQTMIYLTDSEQVSGISGRYFVDCAEAPYSPLVDNRKLRRDLWDLSVNLIKPFLKVIDPILM